MRRRLFAAIPTGLLARIAPVAAQAPSAAAAGPSSPAATGPSDHVRRYYRTARL